MENGLVISVKPEDVKIVKNDDLITITIKNDMSLMIKMDNDVMLKTQGDFHILSDGEISFASKNNIYLDSIDSNIYLNSRNSSILKDEPESIKYRIKQQLEYNKKQLEMKQESVLLQDRITKLEKQMEKYICQE